MEKIDKKVIKQVCKDHKVDHVLVSEDGHIFLPKAINHAKNHRNLSGAGFEKVSSDGELIAEAVKKSPKENLNLNRGETPLSKMNKQQLKSVVADILSNKSIEAPAEDATKTELVEWIKKSKAAIEEGSSPSVGENPEGSGVPSVKEGSDEGGQVPQS